MLKTQHCAYFYLVMCESFIYYLVVDLQLCQKGEKMFLQNILLVLLLSLASSMMCKLTKTSGNLTVKSGQL